MSKFTVKNKNSSIEYFTYLYLLRSREIIKSINLLSSLKQKNEI